MIHLDVDTLSFVALTKCDRERQWTNLTETFPINPDCLSWTEASVVVTAAAAAASVAARKTAMEG